MRCTLLVDKAAVCRGALPACGVVKRLAHARRRHIVGAAGESEKGHLAHSWRGEQRRVADAARRRAARRAAGAGSWVAE